MGAEGTERMNTSMSDMEKVEGIGLVPMALLGWLTAPVATAIP